LIYSASKVLNRATSPSASLILLSRSSRRRSLIAVLMPYGEGEISDSARHRTIGTVGWRHWGIRYD
jgi:hypothetical protein